MKGDGVVKVKRKRASPLSTSQKEVKQIEKVIMRKLIGDRFYYFIKWKGLSYGNSTWISEKDKQKIPPELDE